MPKRVRKINYGARRKKERERKKKATCCAESERPCE
jgi:hypothetical protein